MLAEKDPYIESAYRKLQAISLDKEKRLEYEAREKAIRDHNQFMLEARESGREEGIAIGEKRGREEGIAIGEKHGIERICRLQDILIRSGRYEDLARVSKDGRYREKLLNEYGI